MNPRPRRDLYFNALTGTVPSELAALTALQVLYVRGPCGGAPFPCVPRHREGRSCREGFSDRRVPVNKQDMLLNSQRVCLGFEFGNV